MIASLQFWLFVAVNLVCFAIQVWALADCAIRPTTSFTNAGKLTKTKWLLITGGAAIIGFLSLPLPPYWRSLLPIFITLIGAVAAAVYLADVRPAVRQYSPRRRRGPSSGSW